MSAGPIGFKQRLLIADLQLCSFANLGCRWSLVRWFFSIISRLGDGILWYCLIAMLPLVAGRSGALVAVQMIITGLLGLVIYRRLKTRTGRPRPYQVHAHIRHGARALDPGSFPSGHTLHAVSFSLLLIAAYPGLWVVLLPLCVLIALSRLVLGLHYPSDVLSGAVIGWLLAQLSIWTGSLAGLA